MPKNGCDSYRFCDGFKRKPNDCDDYLTEPAALVQVEYNPIYHTNVVFFLCHILFYHFSHLNIQKFSVHKRHNREIFPPIKPLEPKFFYFWASDKKMWKIIFILTVITQEQFFILMLWRHCLHGIYFWITFWIILYWKVCISYYNLTVIT